MIPMRHELKSWPEQFQAVVDGTKTFEVRVNDRGFTSADELLLREFVPGEFDMERFVAPPAEGENVLDFRSGRYTGRSILVRVGYLMRGPAFGIPEGHVVMAISPDPTAFSKAAEDLNLYCISYDSMEYYVEAESMPAAITAWKDHVALAWGDDYDGTEEPESCAFIHDEPVIRSTVVIMYTNQQPPAASGERKYAMPEPIDSGLPFRDIVARSLHLQGKADSGKDTDNLQVDEASEFLSIVLDVLAHEHPHSATVRELLIRKETRPPRPMPQAR